MLRRVLSLLCRRGVAPALTLLTVLALGVGTVSAQTVSNPCTGFGTTQITMNPVLPPNFNLRNQTNADCIAWQQFIYMNWTASSSTPGMPDTTVSASQFGLPSNTRPTVWQTYVLANLLFSGDSAALKKAAAHPGRLNLSVLSEASTLDLSAIGQASGTKLKPQWLTDQRGGLTYYTVSINLDEAAYITSQNLTSFAGQEACASNPGQNGKGGFNLPMGPGDVDCAGNAKTFGLNVGSVELKAAWVVLPSDGSLNYRYLTAQATVTDPYGNTSNQTVGLTGLHIIRRLPGAPQFLWSTFEQVDNAPDNGGNTVNLPPNPNRQASPGYTYFNPSCDPATDFYQCKVNTAPTTPCTNTSPPYLPQGCSPYAAPMQVTRMTPVESVANSTNQYAWSLFPAQSVFNYYRLIDVQWPNLPTAIPPQSVVPLTVGGITPATATRVVANTTMETYVQTSAACMDCHQYGDIAQAKAVTFFRKNGMTQRSVTLFPMTATGEKAASSTPDYATSYSFIFSADTVK
jgi:hypothetical protein